MGEKNKKNFIPILGIFLFRFYLIILCTILGINSQAYSYAARFRQVKDKRFIIYYEDAPYTILKNILLKANYYADRIGKDLRLPFGKDKIEIYIYRDLKRYLSLTNQTFPGAVTSLKERKIQTYFGVDEFLDIVLPHELTHIFFREFVGLETKGIPLWLEEGIACLQDKQRRLSYQTILRTAAKKSKIFSLEELAGISDLSQLEEDRQEIFYTQSTGLIDYLINKFGKARFLKFLQALRDNEFSLALESIYGFKKIEELREEWQRFLRIR